MSKWYKIEIPANDYDIVKLHCALDAYAGRTKVKFYNNSGTSIYDPCFMMCIKFKEESDAVAFKLEWL